MYNIYKYLIFLEGKIGAFWCESKFVDARPEDACLIYKVAKTNGIDVTRLQVADNCGCKNGLPGISKCQHTNIGTYFANCK